MIKTMQRCVWNHDIPNNAREGDCWEARKDRARKSAALSLTHEPLHQAPACFDFMSDD